MEREYKIRRKPTLYNEIWFKSRLEARWAVFFDCLGIEYLYEPQFYEVSAGYRDIWFKPDFLLPKLSKYIEIKFSEPLGTEHLKCSGWTKDIADIYVLYNLNLPSEKKENAWQYYHDETMKVPPIIIKQQCWGECLSCGHIDLEEYGDITSCGCYTDKYYNELWEDTDILISPDRTQTKRLKKSYNKAKNHNFTGNGKNKVPMIEYQRTMF